MVLSVLLRQKHIMIYFFKERIFVNIHGIFAALECSKGLQKTGIKSLIPLGNLTFESSQAYRQSNNKAGFSNSI